MRVDLGFWHEILQKKYGALVQYVEKINSCMQTFIHWSYTWLVNGILDCQLFLDFECTLSFSGLFLQGFMLFYAKLCLLSFNIRKLSEVNMCCPFSPFYGMQYGEQDCCIFSCLFQFLTYITIPKKTLSYPKKHYPTGQLSFMSYATFYFTHNLVYKCVSAVHRLVETCLVEKGCSCCDIRMSSYLSQL